VPHLDRAAVRSAREALAPLRQRVLAWIDADLVFPADGAALLAALERAREGLAGANAAAARAGLETFMDQVQGLIEAGVLEAADGVVRTAAAAAMVLLRSEGRSDG
jgi:hypothetical protein